MTSNARERILKKLRAAQQPFTDLPPVTERRRMVVQPDVSPAALQTRFIIELQKIGVAVHEADDDEGAIAHILELIGGDTAILSWDMAHIPVRGLAEALNARGIQVAAPEDSTVRLGLTGVDAALASTGSLAVISGAGKHRTTSLLPEVHVAVVRRDQIVTDLETFFEQQRTQGLDTFRQAANVVLITGASRTADIAMVLVQGAHGPRAVHVILI